MQSAHLENSSPSAELTVIVGSFVPSLAVGRPILYDTPLKICSNPQYKHLAERNVLQR